MFDMRMKRRKICRFCENKITHVDYKDERLLRRFVNERGKIIPLRISGNCARHQRKLTTAVKRARILAIMAFESESYR
jgi:small subunit ribosomal protein S18